MDASLLPLVSKTVEPTSVPQLPAFTPVTWKFKPVVDAPTINSTNVSTQERQLTLAAENAPVRVIYGEVRLGAQLLNVLAHGSYIVIQCLWGYACEGVQSVTLNDAALPSGSSETHYDGSQSTADATLVAAFAAQSPSVTYEDTLEGFAYSVLKIPASKLEGGLSINAAVRGREVYDPRTTLTAYSTNPTLILADFLSNADYGCGLTVDWTTAETCADANDDTTIGEVHRQLDGFVLDQVRSVSDVVETLRAYAGVFLSRRGNTVYFVEDAARASDATYAHASGQIESYGRWTKRDTGDTPTVVEVLWTDTSVTPHRERSAVASLAGVGTTKPRRLSTVRLNGIQRYSQAYREAVERLNKLSTSDLSGEITVFDQGIAHEPGDVVTVTLPFGITSKAMRIASPPEAAGPGLWRLQLSEYDAAAYSTEIASEPTYPDTDLPSPTSPPQPTVAATEEVYQTETGIYASRGRLTITSSTFIWTKHYEVEVWDGATLIDSGTTQTGSYATPALQEGVTYTCKARIVSTIGSVGDWGMDSFTAQGKSLVPGDVSAVSGFEVGGDVYLAWDAAVDVDIWRYEIRWGTTGSTWETASLLDRIDGLRYISKGVVSPGVRRFYVKAIDSIGQYSENAAYADVTVTIDPDALQIEYYPDDPSLTGMQTYTERDGTTFDITSVGTQTVSGQFPSALDTYTQPIAAYWGGTSSWEGDAEDPWGLSLAATWDLDGTALDVGTGTSTASLRLSTDGTNFTDYTGTALPAKVSARYARALFTTTACMKVTRGDVRVYGNAVTRSEYGSVTVTSTGTPGALVQLTGSYFQRRNILLTPVENSGTSAYYAVADNIQLDAGTGTNSFDVYLFDSGGNRVAGTCDYRFEGGLMAYTAFDKTKPDATVDDGADFGANTKANLLALRDSAVASTMQGWNYSYTGTASQPSTVVWVNGTERVQETYTWGTDGSLTKVTYRYSSNSGTNYDTMVDSSGYHTHTFTYDGSGNLTASAWGDEHMSIGFLAAIKAGVTTLTGRLTSGRATALDNLDAAVTSRAAASTALSSATWTAARAGYLDKIGIKSIQTGTITVEFPASGSIGVQTDTATLGTAVSTSLAVCLNGGIALSSSGGYAVNARLALTDGTTVTAYSSRGYAYDGSYGTATAYVGYTVIEFNG